MATAQTHSNGAAPEPAKATIVAPAQKKKRGTRAYVLLGSLVILGLGVYFVHDYLTRDQEETDDAQVDADVVPISTQVKGVVVKMAVTDNAHVDAGQLIAQIDDREYQNAVAKAKADLDGATAQAKSADEQVAITKSTSGGSLSSAQAMLTGQGASVQAAAAQVQVATAQIARAKAELTKAQQDYDRANKLHAAGAVSGSQLETATAARDSAQAALDTAYANLTAARDAQAQARARVAEAQGHLEEAKPVDSRIAAAVAAADLAHAKVDDAKSALAQAQLQLSWTHIIAPVAGTVSRLGAHEGQLVQTGTTLVMIVPSVTYVIANFKETQLGRIRPGDPAEISIDALGGKTLTGKVESLSPGTGARFSLLPPDNATGNFVKVVQRVPIKIAWTPGQDLSQLHAGLSVEVKVHMQH